MSDDENEDELDALRRRRLQELQRAAVEEQRQAQVQQQVEHQKQSLLRRILTPEARQRLGNIKIVKPEFAQQLEMELIRVAQSGRISIPITDEQLKKTLGQLQSQRREIKIRRT